MRHIAHHPPQRSFFHAGIHKGEILFKRLSDFAEGQQKNRLGWVAGSMMITTTVLFPATILIVTANGGSFLLTILAVVCATMVLVANLAIRSTRLMIPIFLAAVVLELLIMLNSFWVPASGY